MTTITEDTKKLIDYSVDFAKKILTDYKEFFTFSVTINLVGDRIPTGYFDGDNLLSRQDLITKLQKQHDQQLVDNQRRAYSLTYLAKVKKDNSSEKTDAIAIRIKHADTKDITVYYFAYRLTQQNTIEYFDKWNEILK